MSTPKRYYWIKLRESFMSSDTVDFLMSQKDGANYVVLYQLLCLKTINTGGRLSRTIGEIVIPYDVDKIQRDCKWFSTDTIRIALTLYKRFGLIYEERDGTLVLADHGNLVGSETSWAVQKRNQKRNQQKLEQSCDHVITSGGEQVETGVENFHPDIRYKEIRDKRLDNRDKEKDVVVVGNPYVDNDDNNVEPVQDTLVLYATGNLQYLSPYNMEELISFRDTLPDELIRYAIDQACANGVRTYAYTRSILNSYVSNGFKSVGDAQAHDEKRRQNQQSRKSGTTDYSNEDESDPFKGW